MSKRWELVLQPRIEQIVQMTLCKEVRIAIEASDRMNDRIEQTFQNFKFYRGSKRIPTECGFMPKSLGEPALEVADFVMHAVGGRHGIIWSTVEAFDRISAQCFTLFPWNIPVL